MTIGSVHPKPRKRLVTALFPLRSPQVAKLPDVTAFSTPRERARDGDLETPTQLPFMPSEEDLTQECIHGLTRAWCDICSSKLSQPKPRREKATPLQVVDLLDLVLPLLQPPLGENFDNVVSFPPGTRLYPFQPEGVRFLAEQTSALLGDEMGLGKSIQAIIALRILFRTGKVRNVLLLCPKSVVSDWDKKLWVWVPELRIVRVRASKQQPS
jgi:hypothetical protein